MNPTRDTVGGLEVILEEFDERFETDRNGRLTHLRGEGILPRFVLGRAAEGCIWRFSAGLGVDQVNAVARLAGREPGIPIAGESPASRPERLVMIERILANEAAGLEARCEFLVRVGVNVAELWTIR